MDDAVSARILAWAHSVGKLVVIAAGLNTTFANGAPSLDGFLASEGITGIPIAVPLTSHVPNGFPPYQATMKTRTAAFVDPDRVYGDAVTVYRTALANAVGKVDIISVGYLNNLQELMNSPADGISALTGKELIADKVRLTWIMGGVNPSGTSNNFDRTAQARASARDVATNWPTVVIYAGHEIGTDIITGDNLAGTQATDILAQALLDHGSAAGRPSWDPTTVLASVGQDPALSGFGLVRGTNRVDSVTGANTFYPIPNGKDWYMVKTIPDSDYKTIINTLLVKTNWGSYDPFD